MKHWHRRVCQEVAGGGQGPRGEASSTTGRRPPLAPKAGPGRGSASKRRQEQDDEEGGEEEDEEEDEGEELVEQAAAAAGGGMTLEEPLWPWPRMWQVKALTTSAATPPMHAGQGASTHRQSGGGQASPHVLRDDWLEHAS